MNDTRKASSVRFSYFLVSLLTVTWVLPCMASQIDILVSEKASSPEEIAAHELKTFLTKLYPLSRFSLRAKASRGAAYAIRLGTPESMPDLVNKIGGGRATQPESYVVTTVGAKTGIIFGADPRGVIYGVYGLLEKLGCGFYLTSDSLPEVLPGDFSLTAWDLKDHPLVRDRYVFNWHNFLSGCTGWNYDDWETWIVQSQKMGFNTIMVHAYGNNPMFTYSFNGITKEVGYYGSSRKGRDWGRQHINDVRRMPGGEIFDGPVFGSEAALVPDEKRIEAAQFLMKRVFTCAEQRGMDICFALDIDTTSVLLQDMIKTLPESARFSNGQNWLPLPDTKEGGAFYHAQVQALLKLYPEIDTISLWRRSHAAEWGVLKRSDQLPVAWREQYEAIVKQQPEAADLHQSVCSFAMSKVFGAFRQALDTLGRQDVRLATGSWNTEYIPALCAFLPPEVTIMPLDSNCMPRYRRGFFFEVTKDYANLKTAQGRVMPILWAHHDDGEYIGRPMKSHVNFCDTLDDLEARGYGIIHWMNRPLDLHFRNHEKQVWQSTRNQSSLESCKHAALHWFGAVNQAIMTEYLYDWWTKTPLFGRVTTNKFFHRKEHIPNPEEAIRDCRKRLDMLAGVDLAKMSTAGKQRIAYFQELEEVILSFCHDQELAYRPALHAMNAGDYAEAARLLSSADPVETIHRFSRLSQLDGGDRTEEAMVLSLGTRWITDYVAAKQKLGLEPLRINFAPTKHEPLAQGAGAYTHFIDAEENYWIVRGERETRCSMVTMGSNVYERVRDTGLVLDRLVTLELEAIVPVEGSFRPGTYEATLLLEGTGQAEVSFVSKVQTNTFKPVQAAFLRLVCNGNSENNWNSIEQVNIPSLAAGKPSEIVTAISSVKGYPETAVLEDKGNRWASQGKAWIQFKLDPTKKTDSIEIDWYQGETRQAHYRVETSNDGKTWQPVDWIQGQKQSTKKVTFAIASGRLSKANVTGKLNTSECLSLQMQPISGTPVIAGIELQRVE